MSNPCSYAYCPECKCWLPADDVICERDEETGEFVRVCVYCLENRQDENPGVYDPEASTYRCTWCESDNTTFLGFTDAGPLHLCLEPDCGEEFICLK